MVSNYTNVQSGDGLLPMTILEKKLMWMEKRMKNKREKTMKVGDTSAIEDFYKTLNSTMIGV